MTTARDIFGSSDDDSDGFDAPTDSRPFDVNKLFEDSDDDSDTASAPPPKKQSRLKKAAPKKLKKKKKPKPVDEDSDEGDDDSESKKKKKDKKNKDHQNQTAYDSGSEVEENDNDRSFIASDDDLEEVKNEYDQEEQRFNDEEGVGYDSEQEEQNKKRKGGYGSGRQSETSLAGMTEEDMKNPIIQAVVATKRKRSRDMEDKDKGTMVITLLEKMDDAKRKDDEAIEKGTPAMNKLKALVMVQKVLQNRTLHEVLLDYNILENIRDWLEPWPSEDSHGREVPLKRRNLPNLTLRTALYHLLAPMSILPEHLRNSERTGLGLGKVIMLLFKHPNETMDNKRRLKKLLEEWSRHIFKKTKDYRQLAQMNNADRGERGGGDDNRTPYNHHDHESRARQNSYNSRQSGMMGESVDDLLANVGRSNKSSAAKIDRDSTSSRVQVPYRDGFHFKVRPQSQVHSGDGPRKKVQSEKRQRLSRQFKELKRPGQKNMRAKSMSVEGRGAHLV